MNKTMTIVVTGANGQLGNELRDLAASHPAYKFIFYTREELPITSDEQVKELFSKDHPSWIINCAAYTAVDKAESEPEEAMKVNGWAPGMLATLCRENNCRFIHVSTDYVFNGESSTPYKEDDPTDPQGEYGRTKLAGEKAILNSNNDSIIIRTSWVYSSYGKNFVKTMLRLMNEKKEIKVVNDQIGSPTYAADLARVIMQLIEKKSKGGIYHYSNDGVISWFEFALAVRDLSGAKCNVLPIPTSEYPTPAKRPAYSVLDTSKIKAELGLMEKFWKDSLRVCLNKFRP